MPSSVSTLQRCYWVGLSRVHQHQPRWLAVFSQSKLGAECCAEASRNGIIVIPYLHVTASTPRHSSASSDCEPTPDGIDSILCHVAEPDAPGLALFARKDGRTTLERCCGLRDLRVRTKIDSLTNFRLASCTKQFTAMAIMLLVRDHSLSYDTRLTDVFPDFPRYGRSITIRHLLSHTSGLPDYEDLLPRSSPQMRLEREDQISDAGVLALLRQATTKFQPGTRWAYSNSGYVLLGEVVAKVSHEPFHRFLRDHIFVPLGMDNTFAYVKGTNEVPNRAYGHSKQGGVWLETDQDATSATLGDGGVYSSLTDLAKWDDELTCHSLLSAEEMQPALLPVAVPKANPYGAGNELAAYGFGWFLDPYKGHPRMWHYGETIGFRTFIQRFTRNHLTVVVLCNRSDLNPTALGEQVSNLFFAREARPK
ncbi:MAG: beta-lactamase family protein [Nitrososphaerota archaeon]|nr:beta-lactamase family protein [Nitrososphaerota archaeon]